MTFGAYQNQPCFMLFKIYCFIVHVILHDATVSIREMYRTKWILKDLNVFCGAFL